jgi:hypothetical protein
VDARPTARSGLAIAFAGTVHLCMSACTSLPPAPTAKDTVSDVRQRYLSALNSCQLARSARLSTLGPTIFQPISGDEVFNECVTRAKASLEVALAHVD